MRAFVLKTGATMLAVAATVLSSVYVTAHLKNPTAPLQPAVLKAGNGVTAFGGTVSVSPAVQPGTVQPVTSTYAS